MKEITIITKNEVGTLASIAEALGGVGVNIEAVSAYGESNSGVLRLITNDVLTARKALSRIPGMKINEADVLVLKLLNKPGELGKITRKLANRAVNLESVYIVAKEHDYTQVAVKPATPEDFLKAKEVLGIK